MIHLKSKPHPKFVNTETEGKFAKSGNTETDLKSAKSVMHPKVSIFGGAIPKIPTYRATP